MFGWLGLGLAVLLLTGCSSEARNISDFFATSCANCHGLDLRGGSARSLITNTWTYGSDDASIARVIREGDTNRGMPSFQAAL